jgi:hypothetical protein
MSEIYSNPTNNPKAPNRFRTYFRWLIAILLFVVVLLATLGTYVISLPEYSVYRMYQANANSSYTDMSRFIDTQSLATSIVDQREIDFEAAGIDRDELIAEVSSQLVRDIRRSTQNRTFFDLRFRNFVSYFNNSEITTEDGLASFSADTSFGQVDMKLRRENLKWVWYEAANGEVFDIDQAILELSDRPAQIQLDNLQIIDLEGSLLAAEELQISLNSYQINESLEAIPNSFSPSLPDRPGTRYLTVNITVEYLGEGTEVLLALSVTDSEDENYEVYSRTAPITEDISGETLVAGVPVTGNLLFEIDQENEPVYLQYGNFFETRYRIRLDSVDDDEEGNEGETQEDEEGLVADQENDNQGDSTSE